MEVSSYPSPNPGPITSLPYEITYELKTDYCGNIVYEDDVLSCIRTGEGFIEFSGSGVPTYHYYLRDHQGNNRVVIDQNNNVVQINDYYPFGGIFGDASAQQSKQRYKFGDKEFDRMNALDWLDFSARMYDPVIARFNSPDPLAEKYYSVSPYAYCLNNPIKYVDPDGRDVWEIDHEGRIINRIKDTTQDAFFMVTKDADGNYQRTFTTDANGNKAYDSVSFEYGTVESQRTISINSSDSYDVYRVRGDDNGTQLFEFMGNNITGSSSQVEVSQIMTGVSGEKGLNFITTSHEKKTEKGMSYLLKGQLLYGYSIRELNHSHPVGSTPSGNVSPNPKGDLGFQESVNNALKRTGRSIPSYNIYHVPTKTWIPY